MTHTPDAIAVGGEIPAQVARRLSCLVDVARVVNSSLELNAVLDHILSQARSILEAASGSIMLLKSGGAELEVVAAFGPRARRIQGRTQKLDQGVAGWVASTGQPLLIHGSTSDPRFKRVCRRNDVRDALCVPLQAEEQLLGVVSLNNREGEQPFTEADLELLTAFGHQAALAIRNARSYEEMRRQRRTVERLLNEVTCAQEEERKRIALQIHDGPAQTMFAVLRNLETARAVDPADTTTFQIVMDELERIIRSAIQETRGLMLDLRPPVLDEMGLHSALRSYVEQFEMRTGIRTEVRRQGLLRRLPSVLESCFYRITQEALTNVWKHAEARHAWVLLDLRERTCALEIKDDGKGFDPEEFGQREGQHLGLSSLRDRVELVGGQLSVVTDPGVGTVIRVTAPVTD